MAHCRTQQGGVDQHGTYIAGKCPKSSNHLGGWEFDGMQISNGSVLAMKPPGPKFL